MKRYTISDLVFLDVLGFGRAKAEKKLYDKLVPLEPILRRVYLCDEEDRVILESKSYSSKFCMSHFETVHRIFKDAELCLANPITNTEGKKLPSLLIFLIGKGYFVVLTPFREAEQS